MPVVLLGNHAALDRGQPVDGEQVTMVVIPESDTHSEGFRSIAHSDGVWSQIAAEPAVWVASESSRMATALSAHFDCPVIPMNEAQKHLDRAHRVLGGKRDTEIAELEQLVEQPSARGRELG